jgi:exopolyphosphatase/guanosine-5'-triphosphate,3'-diphosphate pyrophosphatase
VSRPVAALDCGTNSTRLLVTDGTTQFERRMTITRLGKGVDATGRMQPEAVERTLDVLREYRSLMDLHDVGAVRAAATSASRDAANREDFFGPATEILGVRPELISGTEEAALSFSGATFDLDPIDGPFLVVDVGGGSTEFAVGASRVEGSISTQMGCVRLTEKWLQHDPPLPEELTGCLAEVTERLDEVVREVPMVLGARRFVGLAGTITNVAAVELGEYDPTRVHHFRLTRAVVEEIFRTLATESTEDRKHNPGLEPARADVIVGGLCVLVGVMRFFDFGECLVSESDILDGLAMSILEKG